MDQEASEIAGILCGTPLGRFVRSSLSREEVEHIFKVHALKYAKSFANVYAMRIIEKTGADANELYRTLSQLYYNTEECLFFKD